MDGSAGGALIFEGWPLEEHRGGGWDRSTCYGALNFRVSLFRGSCCWFNWNFFEVIPTIQYFFVAPPISLRSTL